MSEEAEWRRAPNAGSAGESRVGAPMNPLLQGSDLGTTTDDRKYGDDGDDEYLPSRKGGKNVRGTDRDLIFGFSLIEQLCTRFGISQNICNRASNIFKVNKKRIVLVQAFLYAMILTMWIHFLVYSSLGGTQAEGAFQEAVNECVSCRLVVCCIKGGGHFPAVQTAM